jgi:hypothetical protein
MKTTFLVLVCAAILAGQTKVVADSYVLYDRTHLALSIQLKPDPPTAGLLKGTIAVSCGTVAHGVTSFQQAPDQTWFDVPLLSPALPKDADCQAIVNTEAWAPGVTAEQRTGTLRFNTKPQMEFEKEVLKGRFGLRVILKANYPVSLRKSADYEVYEVSLRPGQPSPCKDSLFTCTRVPDTRLVDLQGTTTPIPPDGVGRIAIYFTGDRLTRANPVLLVRNIVSVLDEDIVLKEPKAVEFPSAPKGKDQAYGYIAVVHQAGPRARPGTALDAKFNPMLFRTGRFLHGPDLTADLIWNTVSGLKSNDLIHLGWRAERFLRFGADSLRDPVLPGLRLAPALYLETNRLRTQQNFIASGAATLFFRGLYDPQAIRTRRNYLNQVAANPGISPELIPLEPWGWSWNFEPGFETGSAIRDVVAKASDKSGSITVPGYGIFRAKMRTNLKLEYRRFALEGSAEFRYLALHENVFRETSIDVLGADGKPAKRTVLSIEQAKGIKPALDLKLRFRIDPLGHYQLETGFKNGALPPGFIYANAYRSGVAVQF